MTKPSRKKPVFIYRGGKEGKIQCYCYYCRGEHDSTQRQANKRARKIGKAECAAEYADYQIHHTLDTELAS